jgi:hypothetical protein
MKRYSMSWSAANEHKPKLPDRTTRHEYHSAFMNVDVIFTVWPTRKAMSKAIRKQEDDMVCGSDKLYPVVKISDGEGY